MMGKNRITPNHEIKSSADASSFDSDAEFPTEISEITIKLSSPASMKILLVQYGLNTTAWILNLSFGSVLSIGSFICLS